MQKATTIILATLMLISASAVLAMQDHNSGSHSDDDKKEMSAGGGFMHEATAEDIRAEFQVMSLESMNMKDPEGNTHHIMVKLFPQDSDQQIKEAVGKVKIISPSKKETTATLKDYSGIFAANFMADEPGKYGIICLLKVKDKKPLYKFWYHHMK